MGPLIGKSGKPSYSSSSSSSLQLWVAGLCMDTEHNVHEENQVAHERLSLATLTETERLKDDRRAATDAVRAQVGEAGLQIELLELKNWRRAGRSRPLFLRFPRLAGRIKQIRCLSTS